MHYIVALNLPASEALELSFAHFRIWELAAETTIGLKLGSSTLAHFRLRELTAEAAVSSQGGNRNCGDQANGGANLADHGMLLLE